MKKIVRNMDTPENRKFWEDAEQSAEEVETWPAWKRAGINVVQSFFGCFTGPDPDKFYDFIVDLNNVLATDCATPAQRLTALITKATAAMPKVERYRWLDPLNDSQAFLACVGAGPWKIGRRRLIQKTAIQALGNQDLRDAVLPAFPLAWQNRFVTSMQAHLKREGVTMETFCVDCTRTDIYEAAGCPKGAKVLSLFCRDKLGIDAFPIDRHVRRVLKEAGLPVKEQELLELCAECRIHPISTATLLVRYASGDIKGELNPQDLLDP